MTQKGERLWCPGAGCLWVKWELSEGTEPRALLGQHFLSGHFSGRFPASYSSRVPRVLGLAGVSRGRLGLPSVQEARAHLQPPSLQCQTQDNLPERPVPERPLPAAAPELRGGHQVSPGVPCHLPVVSCSPCPSLTLLVEAAPALPLEQEPRSLVQVGFCTSPGLVCSFNLFSACLLCLWVVRYFAVTQ